MRAFVSATLVLLAATAFAQKELSVVDIVKRSSDAVVQIVTSDSLGKEMALGSGFLVSEDGRVVTNYHVIKGAHSAVIQLSNGAFFPVDGVLAEDAERDLAVLKVSGKGLPFLFLGDAHQTQVGEHVVAIGSPLGLQNTVSDGIVSAIREENGHQWIQTTAPVSHGNSGGPLMNSSGVVIGVITWGVSLQQGQNLNFAASVAEVQRLLTQLHDARSLDVVQSGAGQAPPLLPKAAAIPNIGTAQKKLSVTLRWNAPRRGGTKVVGYNIYRSDEENGPYGLIAEEVSALKYVDKTVQSGHTYYYRVTSMDAWGRESTAATTKATLP
ncbi:MAG: trypsin-like peptidase domain-containing protein [Terriglobales bacterium]